MEGGGGVSGADLGVYSTRGGGEGRGVVIAHVGLETLVGACSIESESTVNMSNKGEWSLKRRYFAYGEIHTNKIQRV